MPALTLLLPLPPTLNSFLSPFFPRSTSLCLCFVRFFSLSLFLCFKSSSFISGNKSRPELLKWPQTLDLCMCMCMCMCAFLTWKLFMVYALSCHRDLSLSSIHKHTLCVCVCVCLCVIRGLPICYSKWNLVVNLDLSEN